MNYAPKTQSNNYPSTTLVLGVQEVSEDMWLHILIGHVIQSRRLEKSFCDLNSDYCVQACWQGPLLSRNNMYLHLEYMIAFPDF